MRVCWIRALAFRVFGPLLHPLFVLAGLRFGEIFSERKKLSVVGSATAGIFDPIYRKPTPTSLIPQILGFWTLVASARRELGSPWLQSPSRKVRPVRSSTSAVLTRLRRQIRSGNP